MWPAGLSRQPFPSTSEPSSFTRKRESGRIKFVFKGVRYLLIRPETLITFQKATEKGLSEKASQMLFQSGFMGGTLSSSRYREVFGLSDQEIIQFMIEMGPQIGWGRFELERFDSNQKCFTIKVFHSPFAEAYGSSPVPVCHLIRGVLSGMASVVFDCQIEGKELFCLANPTSAVTGPESFINRGLNVFQSLYFA